MSMNPRNRRPGLFPALMGGTCLGMLLAATYLHGQERQANPPVPAPPRKSTDPVDPAQVDPPKKVLNDEPRKQTDTEIVPPVKVGMVLETTADGVLIQRVVAGSAADEAGLKRGDLIVKIAGKQVLTPVAIDRRFHNYKAGTKLEVVALRDGKEVTTTIVLPRDHEPVLFEKPDPPPKEIHVIEKPVPVPSSTVVAAPVDVGWVLQEKEQRVWLSEVHEGSIAAAAGLRRGDILTSFNRNPVTGIQPFQTSFNGLQPGAIATFEVARAGRAIPVQLTIPVAAQRTAVATSTTVATATTMEELLRRQQIQEELLTKVLAELQAIRAELKTKR